MQNISSDFHWSKHLVFMLSFCILPKYAPQHQQNLDMFFRPSKAIKSTASKTSFLPYNFKKLDKCSISLLQLSVCSISFTSAYGQNLIAELH
jgi:hypothetical protein